MFDDGLLAGRFAACPACGEKFVVPGIPFVHGKGEFDFDIVGESHYQETLELIAGGWTYDGCHLCVDAIVLPEDSNLSDKQAVRVDISGATVGYLTREDARRWRRWLVRKGLELSPVTCKALITGGWNRGGDDWGHFGVRLDFPLRPT